MPHEYFLFDQDLGQVTLLIITSSRLTILSLGVRLT